MKKKYDPERAFDDAADLILDGLEDAIGMRPIHTRDKTKTALLAILNYFFVARQSPGPVAIGSNAVDRSNN